MNYIIYIYLYIDYSSMILHPPDPHVLLVIPLLTRKDEPEGEDPLPLADTPPAAELQKGNCGQVERK